MHDDLHDNLLGLGKDLVSALAMFLFLAALFTAAYGLKATQHIPV